ncbi:glutathione S-transferase [Capronia epimyces CBS 606.96]|uniref:Glutathione S-transferase n=1 Tax=Capronia epimyces CBS 606.96 TaxID=1182542 RepID=W9XU81_9EURO|nr:glutathione S-transferase [Capronia epimyces CBS 606.96]EXJ80865.1 glutathione S-transferase [Capronia epimyces CBS 606.96]
MATSTRSSKRQKTDTNADADDKPFRLIYWLGIPGRGEHVRLAFEATGTRYTDVSNQTDEGVGAVLKQTGDDNNGDEHNPPAFAPPILQHGDDVTIWQTPNILLYLGPKLGLVPDAQDDPVGLYHVNALALTALDGLSNEPHDVHHPIAVILYYEDQKTEALRKAKDYRENRLPKFLAYFERVLDGPASAGGEYLYGGKLSYADLVLFQTLDGVSFAFPKCVGKIRDGAKYPKVWALYERVKALEPIKNYLASDRRLKYTLGIYRHYPELDDE